MCQHKQKFRNQFGVNLVKILASHESCEYIHPETLVNKAFAIADLTVAKIEESNSLKSSECDEPPQELSNEELLAALLNIFGKK